jgi:AAA15 family ATPase/GTPase
MIIDRIEIEKFRGFKNVSFGLGTQLTIIAGKNGTQKTTILGMLSQPFTISGDDNPMTKEKPLSGGSYKSSFDEKFKLSTAFDTAKSHEWTLYLHDNTEPFTIESILRNKTKPDIRFWRKGKRDKGSGYIQLPVIFLSLTRLLPIGEDSKLKESGKIVLSQKETELYQEWFNKILISHDNIKNTHYLESPKKNTLGVNTDVYDWKQNSSGQDNIGKILLAILSFKRLKENYPTNYKGGILAIDELDATLYPGSQIKLIELFRGFASRYDIQIIFTTHSLSILEKGCELQEKNKNVPASKNHVKVIFLEKVNNEIIVLDNANLNTIKHRLNVTIGNKDASKIPVYTEDKEAIIFTRALLKGKASNLKFIDCTLGCTNLIELVTKKIPTFIFPNSIVFLDGDIKSKPASMQKINKSKNIILLPTEKSPEQIIANFLSNSDENSPFWKKINKDFTRAVCFKDFSIKEITEDRIKAKAWFNSHLKDWGTNATKVINPWMSENKVEVDEFINQFTAVYNRFAIELSIEPIR